jgi:hypothetical protein
MDENTVHELARAADLPLSEERLALLAPQLGTWLAAANELSRKLAADEHRPLIPITVFGHPSAEGREE